MTRPKLSRKAPTSQGPHGRRERATSIREAKGPQGEGDTQGILQQTLRSYLLDETNDFI